MHYSQQNKVYDLGVACLLRVHACQCSAHKIVAWQVACLVAELKGQVDGCQERSFAMAANMVITPQEDGAMEVEAVEKDLEVVVSELVESMAAVAEGPVGTVVVVVAVVAVQASGNAEVQYLLAELVGESRVLELEIVQWSSEAEAIEKDKEQREMDFVVEEEEH